MLFCLSPDSESRTELSLLQWMNHIVAVLQKKQNCATLFIDLSKVFDTVNEAQLKQRLCHLVVCPSSKLVYKICQVRLNVWEFMGSVQTGLRSSEYLRVLCSAHCYSLII